ncbi:DUF4240 domain-containing protein [Paenibacillus massiliensis]|uniref:DUF4240 domain-containing protein n=1 Tax=Paenibacillus massiliensis TaxID=225917 RepID=UPI000423B9A2|nr:DUF4240 domain-containing protein [Paenibacillus massiliensis]
MEKLLWEIIEDSKQNKAFLKSEVQFETLKRRLSQYGEQTNKELMDEFHKLWEKLRLSDEFERLHEEEGGIISDDWSYEQFYMDFGSWIVAQGKDLYYMFFREGHEAVLSYIEERGVTEEDYMFESMMYAFKGD